MIGLGTVRPNPRRIAEGVPFDGEPSPSRAFSPPYPLFLSPELTNVVDIYRHGLL